MQIPAFAGQGFDDGHPVQDSLLPQTSWGQWWHSVPSKELDKITTKVNKVCSGYCPDGRSAFVVDIERTLVRPQV